MIIWARPACWSAPPRRSPRGRYRCSRRSEIEEACRRRKDEQLAREILQGQQQAAVAAEALQVFCDALFLTAATLALFSVPGVETWELVGPIRGDRGRWHASCAGLQRVAAGSGSAMSRLLM